MVPIPSLVSNQAGFPCGWEASSGVSDSLDEMIGSSYAGGTDSTDGRMVADIVIEDTLHLRVVFLDIGMSL